MKVIIPIIPIISILVLVGCSTLSGRREVLDKKKQTKTVVSQEQYQQLLGKYETLLKYNRKTPAAPKKNLDSIANELASGDMTMPAKMKQVELAETVDVFGYKGVVRPEAPPVLSAPIVKSDMEIQMTQLENAQTFINKKQHDAAMNILMALENSPSRQMQVRAKYLMGEVLFDQGAFDQAMQVYRDIVDKYAFSGVTLKALARLVACTDKLKLAGEHERYFSMLNDIFQST